jgi:hypothetical protein
MVEKLLLAFVIWASLNLLPGGALGLTHDDLRPPQVADTGGLTAVIAMEMGDDQLGDVMKIQPDGV